jgi:hypothetical protein
MERALERGAAGGRSGLMAEFRKTRVKAAQAHDVEAALIGDNVNMNVLKNIGSENLTGGLQRLARIAEEFPELTKTQSTIRSGDSSLSIAFSPAKLTAQRLFGKGQTERLLSDQFQDLYGAERSLQADTPLGPAARMEQGPAAPAASVAERRTSTEPYTGIDRRVNGVPDLSAEREAVLAKPVGSGDASDALVSQLLANPEVRTAVRGDTRANRARLNPEEAGIGDALASPDASIQATIDRLTDLGLSPEEIAEILARGQ